MKRSKNNRSAKRRRKKTRRRRWPVVILTLVVIALLATLIQHRASDNLDERAALNGGFPLIEITPQLETQLDNILHDLIITHPRREISVDLLSLLNSQIMKRRYLSIDLVGENLVAGAFQAFQLEDGTLDPQMDFSAGFLLSQNVSRAMKQMAIFHEFQHYKQWREAGDQLEFVPGLVTSLTEAEAVKRFHRELEAHCLECELAEEQGWSDQNPYCLTYSEHGRREMAKQLAINLSLMELYRPHASTLLKAASRIQN